MQSPYAQREKNPQLLSTLQECGQDSQLSQSLKQQAVKMPDSNVTFNIWVLAFQPGF